jgi:signal transduction histidine kinase
MDLQASMKSSIAFDVAAIQSIDAVPSILRVVSALTGLRFVCVARVTQGSWTACAVLDEIDFGLKAGDDLDVSTTLCSEVRDSRMPVAIDKASEDSQYCNHPTPRLYGFESYIAVPIFRRDGAYFGNLCALDPLPGKVSNDKILSTMSLFTELISLQLESEQRHRANQAALLSERETAGLREQFIAVLGHDLRTPLTSIIAGADLLLRRAVDKETTSITERILRSGRRISGMVDEILDFARGRLGGGISPDVRDAVDLEAGLRHVVAELQGADPNRLIRCIFDLHNKVACDPDRLAQLLSNLLTNALKHGAPDEPVDVTARSRDGAFVLSVTNQGNPIQPETIPRLFQPYWRAAGEGRQGGLGLGLYIAAEIARSHGGTIDVSSSARSGTTFTFTLPARS